MEDKPFFDKMISHLRGTCKYYTGYPKDLGPSRVIHFTSERDFVQLLHEGRPVVVAFTIRSNYSRNLDKVLEEAAAEFYPHVKFLRVECPKYPGFCITRQKKEYPFVEIFHSPEQIKKEATAKGPGLYTDIGKKARDLLYRDFQSDHKFTITTYSPTGVAITSSGTKKGGIFLADVNTQLKHKNITTDIKVDTNSNLFTIITVDEPTPGLKAIFSFKVPDQRSGKVELQYLHEHAGIISSVGLTANPIVNFSGVIGSNGISLGGDVSYDTKTGEFIKTNAGFGFFNADLTAAFTLNDKGNTVNASYYHVVKPITNTAVGAEVTHSLKTGENTITVGTQHTLDPLTTVKARVNNFGLASALIQHEWRPRSLLTISGEVDTKAVEKSTKVGLALALKP